MATIIIIAITAFISYNAFNNSSLMEKFIFYPPAIGRGEWYRFITPGFLHADWSHLIFNMFALYLFGSAIESVFIDSFGSVAGVGLYVLLYLLGLIVSIIPTWLKEKDNSYYRSLGASGAVSAIVFAYILVFPMNFMGIIFVPIFLPAFLFGIIYVAASIYLEKKQNSNVNHNAHITGGVFGIAFMAIIYAVFVDINIFVWFIDNIQINSISDLIQFGY